METIPANIKPRRPWLAALLSLLSGSLGQVYAGHFRRSMFLWIIGVFFGLILALCFISLPLGRLGMTLLLLCVPAFTVFLVIDAFLLARRSRDAPLKRYQRWWVYILLYVAFIAGSNALAYVFKTFIGEAFVVPTRSMSPTIMAGDRIFVDKLWASSSRLQRNDVVVYRRKGPDSALYVTRVVGFPGDKIVIKNEQVFVNGAKWDDRHAVFEGPPVRRVYNVDHFVDIANYGPVTVPPDCFFVLGDNRRRAKDSRLLGPIPLSNFYGKALVVYWSHPREFPDPNDTTHYTLGKIRWDRIGTPALIRCRCRLGVSPDKNLSGETPNLRNWKHGRWSRNCTIGRSGRKTMTTPIQVRDFYEIVWNRRDYEIVPRLLAEDFVFRGSLGSELRGRDAFRRYAENVHNALGNYTCDILECIQEGSKAFAKMRFSGVHVGEFPGYPPSGKLVSWHGAALFELSGDVIGSLWVLGDLHGLLAVLRRNQIAQPSATGDV